MAKGRPAKSEFIPKNPSKYVGKYPIITRSSWESVACKFFDMHPNIISWASEPLQIPYLNPLTGRWTVYIPDFIVVYTDKNEKRHSEMIEIKPAKEDFRYQRKPKERLSEATKLTQIVNMAKWQAAAKFCAKNQMSFRVMTEADLFAHKRRK